MISRLNRFLSFYDPGKCGLSARGIACGLHAVAGVGWIHPAGLHVLYRGVGAVDYAVAVGASNASPIKMFPGYTLQPNTVYKFGLRAISPGGVEEVNKDQVVTIETDDSGVPLAPVPNAPNSLIVAPRAGGKFAVTWRYDPTGQQTAPATYAVYADGDYETPVGVVYGTSFLSSAYSHGATVAFCVRARSASGAEEKNTVTRSGVADDQGPDDCEAPTIALGVES